MDMTATYQRENLHQIIDQLDEKWLGKAHVLLSRFAAGENPPDRKEHWNAVRTKIQSFTAEHAWEKALVSVLDFPIASEGGILSLADLQRGFVQWLAERPVAKDSPISLTLALSDHIRIPPDINAAVRASGGPWPNGRAPRAGQ